MILKEFPSIGWILVNLIVNDRSYAIVWCYVAALCKLGGMPFWRNKPSYRCSEEIQI